MVGHRMRLDTDQETFHHLAEPYRREIQLLPPGSRRALKLTVMGRHAKGGTVVAENNSPALTIAMAFYQAWTSKDVDRAMSYVNDDIVCEAPSGRIEGIERYRAFWAPFVQIFTNSDIIAAFGDDETALLMYDARSTLVASALTAEWFTTRDGKISHSRIVFDRTPFDAARKAAG